MTRLQTLSDGTEVTLGVLGIQRGACTLITVPKSHLKDLDGEQLRAVLVNIEVISGDKVRVHMDTDVDQVTKEMQESASS